MLQFNVFFISECWHLSDLWPGLPPSTQGMSVLEIRQQSCSKRQNLGFQPFRAFQGEWPTQIMLFFLSPCGTATMALFQLQYLQFQLQVVPGQAGGGSFKFETPI